MAWWNKKDSKDEAPAPAPAAAPPQPAPAAPPAALRAAPAVAPAPVPVTPPRPAAAPVAAAATAPAPVKPAPVSPAPANAAAAPGATPKNVQVALGSNLTPSLGKVMAVLISSPRHHAMTLSDVYARILPPLTLNQFVVAEARPQGQEQTAPVGVVLWATVSEAVEQRLMTDPKTPTTLKADEWKSGDRPWLIEALGPGTVVEAMVKQLAEGPFKGKSVKMRRRKPDGNGYTIEELQA